MHPSLRQLQDWGVHIDLLANEREIEVLMIQSTATNVDKLALELAFNTIVIRHDALRSYFVESPDSLVWSIATFNPDLSKIEYFDLTMESSKRQAEDAILLATKRKMHDLTRPPLIRVCLFKIDDLTYNLTVMVHHIISDTSSLNIIKNELNHYYNIVKKTGSIGEIERPPQFHEYVARQIKMNEIRMGKQIRFWMSRLKKLDYNSFIHRGMHKESSNHREYSSKGHQGYIQQLERTMGASYTTVIGIETLSNVRNLSKDMRVGAGAILYASLFITLFEKKIGNILISSPISGRDTHDTSKVIGNFMAGIYLYFSYEEKLGVEKFIRSIYSEYILSCRNKIFNHNQVGLSSDRLRAVCDLFFNYESTPIFSDINVELNLGHQKSEEQYYPLSCYMSEYKDKALLRWRYSFMEHTQSSIQDLATRHSLVLEKICQNPTATLVEIIESP